MYPHTGNVNVPFVSFSIMSAGKVTETITVPLSEASNAHIPTIAKFPVEILLYVISFLEIPDILALRKVFPSLLLS